MEIYFKNRALMMEAVRTSEMSASCKETKRHYIPEGCHHISVGLFCGLSNDTVSSSH
jgi:hypothetical protein